MKLFTTITNKIQQHPRIKFVLNVLMYYALIMIIYIYVMCANLSAAPEFIYSQF